MPPNTSVRIEGLRAFQSSLRDAAGKQINDRIKTANFNIAESVRRQAVTKANGVSRVAGLAAKSMRSGRAASAATIRAGGARAPYFFGAEFGALRYKQFAHWKGNGLQAGYFLTPTLRDSAPQTLATYQSFMDAIWRTCFPD